MLEAGSILKPSPIYNSGSVFGNTKRKIFEESSVTLKFKKKKALSWFFLLTRKPAKQVTVTSQRAGQAH